MKRVFWLLTIFILIAPISACPAKKPTTKETPARKVMELPPPNLDGNLSLEEALSRRRSVRSYAKQELTLEQVSQLLWAGQGITESSWGGRTAPSAGALYPIELYLVKNDGVWHYLPKDHQIEKVKDGDVRLSLSAAALGQVPPREAPVIIVITGVYERTAAKYGDRAERYVKLEAGHVCQNILLQAVALELGAVPIGAFNDSAVLKVLSVPSDHKPLYLVPIGHQVK